MICKASSYDFMGQTSSIALDAADQEICPIQSTDGSGVRQASHSPYTIGKGCHENSQVEIKNTLMQHSKNRQ